MEIRVRFSYGATPALEAGVAVRAATYADLRAAAAAADATAQLPDQEVVSLSRFDGMTCTFVPIEKPDRWDGSLAALGLVSGHRIRIDMPESTSSSPMAAAASPEGVRRIRPFCQTGAGYAIPPHLRAAGEPADTMGFTPFSAAVAMPAAAPSVPFGTSFPDSAGETEMDASLLLALSLSMHDESGGIDMEAAKHEIETARRAEEEFFQSKLESDRAAKTIAEAAAEAAARAEVKAAEASEWLARHKHADVVMPSPDAGLPWDVGSWRSNLQ